ncbi:hypothetical protein Anapl_15608 [Anas platyrhynchos]|uniref:Uncharacterized protein n=1 Tax=Anas platyrhynchos TaxID=8839 RepID=R0KYA0_ANAPL|nr:hypothetical protein Anapl_15608 [Anas platyrhynchos]
MYQTVCKPKPAFHQQSTCGRGSSNTSFASSPLPAHVTRDHFYEQESYSVPMAGLWTLQPSSEADSDKVRRSYAVPRSSKVLLEDVLTVQLVKTIQQL